MEIRYITYILYLGLMLLSFVISAVFFKRDRDLRLISILLLLSVLTETIVYTRYILSNKTEVLYFIYHIFIPLEYLLLTMYLQKYVGSPFTRKVMLWSIPVFVLASLAISWSQHFRYPGWNVNAEGILLIAWVIIVLFTLKPDRSLFILELPVFWISVGLLTYFSGGFFFNFIYNSLLEKETTLASNLNWMINKVLNCLLYLLIIVGYLCLRRSLSRRY